MKKNILIILLILVNMVTGVCLYRNVKITHQAIALAHEAADQAESILKIAVALKDENKALTVIAGGHPIEPSQNSSE